MRQPMPPRFHTLIAAQFFSALADNALLILAVGLLQRQGLPPWWAPLLKLCFNAAYVGLAPVVGVPMPLLSYGGTVMMTVMIGFGLVQAVRVHRYTEVTSGKGSLM